ncbi:unnamed protein product [Owenia fusiformis]|uniref:Uncharacterized protein n=1 Tax=Owenia fusiformis TaxID=6347 RepID=A0A8J1XWR6_OWEFU|nr:unnamed protein product [Owenia fusiformis]
MKMFFRITITFCLAGLLRAETCRRSNLLRYENVNCGGGIRCPNTFKCIKGECCKYKDFPDCEPEMNPKTNAPWACRGGGSKTCSPGYVCEEHDQNVYTACCLNVTCVDSSGFSHKFYDKPWISNEDKCNKCSCLKNGEVKCTDKRGCKKCRTPYGLKTSPYQYWKDNCTQCTCKSKLYTSCTTACERGLKDKLTDYTACDADMCGKQVAVQQCHSAEGKDGNPCIGHKIAIKSCNEVGTKCTGRPGKRLKESTPIIIGGLEVNPPHNFPWMVLIDSQGCGASLISPRHILTAAHCMTNKKIKTVTLKTGKHDKTKKEEGEQFREVNKSSVIIHENYNATSHDNDIAIIIVHPPIKLDYHTQPVLLPTERSFTYKTVYRKQCQVTGWGRTAINDWWGSSVLLQVVLKKEACRLNETDLQYVNDNMFCASKDGKDSCFGDSGGPFMCRHPKTRCWTQYGIVSWGPLNSCGEMSGVYTKVSNYIDWINNIISTDGGWGDWTNYTDCANGMRSKARICTNPEPIGNGTCQGEGNVFKDEESGLYVNIYTEKCEKM